tara:strand:+ start:647 stop:919 length:273 start_codon:yes stop_codon:yes gene_type:complete
MLRRARMSGSQVVVRNVTKSNWISPNVFSTRFPNDFGEPKVSDKNDRFRRMGSGKRYMSAPQDEAAVAYASRPKAYSVEYLAFSWGKFSG